MGGVWYIGQSVLVWAGFFSLGVEQLSYHVKRVHGSLFLLFVAAYVVVGRLMRSDFFRF